MKQFVVLLALAIATVNAKTIGWPGFPEGRIINGHEADIAEAPYIVSLQVRNSHNCAGSLLSDRVILTAAHCTGNAMTAVAGVNNNKDLSEAQVRQVSASSQVKHERYSGGVGPYDIALLFVDAPFDLTAVRRDGKPAIATIDLPRFSFGAKADGVLFGWGRDNSGGLPNNLQKLNADIIAYSECKSALPFLAPIHETNICTYTAGKTDGACNGDSGGPLVIVQPTGKVEQVGVVSWGYTPCATAVQPSVFTDVNWFTGWIADHINDK